MRIKRILASVFLCSAFFAGYSFADTGEAEDIVGDEPEWINHVPALSYWGLRGLPQTVSAEPLGMGRVNLSFLNVSYYKQYQDGLISPKKGDGVGTYRLMLSWGVNEEFDVFGIIPFYLMANDMDGMRWSLGGLMGGIQYAVPWTRDSKVKWGIQVQFVQGLRAGDWNKRDVNTNPDFWREDTEVKRADSSYWFNGATYRNDPQDNLTYSGYSFFEAKTNNHLDLIIKNTNSFILFDDQKFALKIHLNEGMVVTPGLTNNVLLLLAGGLQVDPSKEVTLGFELNSRTRFFGGGGNPDILHDPLWFTPSIMYRAPYLGKGLFSPNATVGMDFNLSQKHEDKKTKALERWRVFGDVVFSIDFLASKRAEMERQAREAAAERARLKRQVELTAAQKDSIARQAREDSLRLASEMAERARADSIRAKHVADSLAGEMGDLAEKARLDSIAQAQAAAEAAAAAAQREAELQAQSAQQAAAAAAQRHADSLAQAELQKKLAEERAKRSEAEQMMLSTGMFVLDGVFFATGKPDIQLNSRAYLTQIARMLVKYPKLKMEIGGHTDNVGRYESNMTLSQQRAQAVFSFMVNVEPGLAQMLSVRGYGSDVPKADNNTAAGRELNRRVELKILNPEVLKEYNP